MQNIETLHYPILQIIYQIVKEDPQPLKYQVHPRDLILRSMQDWSTIQASLSALEKEGLIVTRQLESLQIFLTEQGLEICQNPSAE